MLSPGRRWIRGAMWLAALAGGCTSAAPRPLTDLPPHELDLSPHIAARRAPPPPAGRVESPAPWRARGHRPWRYIVIHHSATEGGNAAIFDQMHRRQRGWDSLGYHFVIDNGADAPDGLVEVGSRWRLQKWGAHCGGTPDNEYNNYGIGICLVGDFQSRAPSPKQVASLRRLVTYLMRAHRIPADRVLGHRDAPNARTACPGEVLERLLRREGWMGSRRLAASSGP